MLLCFESFFDDDFPGKRCVLMDSLRTEMVVAYLHPYSWSDIGVA